jgi:membrane protein
MATIPPRGTLGMVPAALRRFAQQLYHAGWRLAEHDGLTVAGYMAFAAFTSLFPFLIFLAALASVLGTRETADETVEGMFLFLPDDVARTLAPAVHEVMAGHHGGLLTFGALATLWTASSGVEALRDALDRAYEVEDPEPLWWRRLQSMVVVVLGALVLFVASLAVVLGPVLWRLAEAFGRPSTEEELAWTIGRYTLGAAVLAGGLLALHRWLPHRRLRARDVLPGVLLTLGLWLAGASLFSLYLGTVADYSVTYGSLGGVVITLFFFYLTGALFILGAEYNAVRLKAPDGPSAATGEAEP